MNEQYSPHLLAGMQAAKDLAMAQHAPELFTVHLLAGLSTQSDTTFTKLLQESGVDIQAFHAFLADRSTRLPRTAHANTKIMPSNEHRSLLQAAQNEAALYGDTQVDTAHILLAALKDRPKKELWHLFNLSYNKVSKL